MRIHILALNGVFDTGLSAVLDAFGTANTLAQMTGVSSLRFQLKVVGLHKSITTARGLSLPVMAAASAPTPDAVVMPAIFHMRPASEPWRTGWRACWASRRSPFFRTCR
jgi:hypothetical protein